MGENASTSEVEDVIASHEEISHASVYGVEIPGTEGRAGMTSIKASKTHENFNFNKIREMLNEHLPKYAIPLFIRFLSELPTTSTFKIQKSNMKKIGFDITKTSDPIYVRLPNDSEYVLLTEEIYKKILREDYRF